MKKILLKAMRLLKRFLIKFICLWHTKSLFPYKNKKLKHQPIFIIGSPRTGSTILYQSLTNYYDVSYIDNCVDKWHQNLFYGFKVSYKKFGSVPHNNFKSAFGMTAALSEHSPAECGGFWYRWLPKERHFIDKNEISLKSKNALYIEVCAVTNFFDKPIIFKNLNAGQRLRFLKEVFPNARFIYIKREHEKVKLSILKAREVNGISANQWWSIKPKNYKYFLNLSESDMVDMQIKKLEEQIEKDLDLFYDVFQLNFNDLSEEKIVEIGEMLDLPRRKSGSLPIFKRD